jgi:hypothetical protein
MRTIEHWMHAHRLSRAVFVAVVVGGLFVWGLWNRNAPMVSRSTQVGRVESVVKGGMTVIALSDGKRVRAVTPHPMPKPGASMPMIVETYEDGSVYAFIDMESWRMEPAN